MEEERKQYENCNSGYSDAEGGRVWCPYEKYPRKSIHEAPDGAPKERCACFTSEELKRLPELNLQARIELWPNCEEDSRECQTVPPKK
mmetsp:Transcript_39796/g.63834  ORF Transcript_39796/g.63834 Transcript_39796/m.63834 type:complete len:88 (+) Transcript_39796:616-879(+)